MQTGAPPNGKPGDHMMSFLMTLWLLDITVNEILVHFQNIKVKLFQHLPVQLVKKPIPPPP